MKHLNLTWVTFFTCFTLLYSLGTTDLRAQNTSKEGQVRIKIEKTEDGQTEVIQKNIELGQGQIWEEVAKELENLALSEDGEQVEIIVRKKLSDGPSDNSRLKTIRILTDREEESILDGDENIEIIREGDDKIIIIKGLGEKTEGKGHSQREFRTACCPEAASKCKKPKKGAYLGVVFEPLKTETAKEMNLNGLNGVLIKEVIPKSPAKKGGLRAGDILTGLNDTPLKSDFGLTDLMKNYSPGEKIHVHLFRKGALKTTKVKLGTPTPDSYTCDSKKSCTPSPTCQPQQRVEKQSILTPREESSPSHDGKAFLGVTFEQRQYDENESQAPVGAVISGTVEGSLAREMELEPGDRIIALNKMKVNSYEEVVETMQNFHAGKVLTVTYLRNGEMKEASGTLTHQPSALNPPKIIQKRLFMDENGEVTELDTEEDGWEWKEEDQQLKLNLKDLESLEKLGKDLEFKFEGLGEELEDKVEMLIEKFKNLDLDLDLHINGEEWDDTRIKEGIEKSIQKFKYIFRDEVDEHFKETVIVITIEDLDDAEAQELSRKTQENIRVENQLKLEDMSLYPNPSDGNFTISFRLAKPGNTTLKIFDVHGKVVYKEDLGYFYGKYENKVNISEQSEGLYYLNISQDDLSVTKKIITR